jgi:medium-chain acyl-[acyl-carrier-protein] hydrolase
MTVEIGKPWVRSWNPSAPLRLVCLPYAGGGTADFRRWKDALLPSVDLVPVVLAGRENRMGERAPSDIGAVVDGMLPALLPVLRAAPFVLYGHSMGAWLAFELVRALRRVGKVRPAHLVVSARRAPHRPARLPALSALPDAAFVDGVQQRYGGIPEAIRSSPELMSLFLPTMRADFTLLDRYRYREEPPLDIPLTSWHGREDRIEDESDVRAWSEHTTGPFQFRQMPGGHFFLRDSSDEVADGLNAILRTI